MKKVSLLWMVWGMIGAAPIHAADTVTVMTFNIRYLNDQDGPDHWEHRVDTVAATVAEADVAGLQEARKPQIDDLAAQLDEFDWYGVGRDDGKEGGEFTPIFWRRDRFELKDQGTFWLSSDPSAVGASDWGARIPRICSWVVLSDRRSGESLWVMNTHFDHQSAKARSESARLMRQKAEQLAQGQKLVMTGDLNCTPEDEPMRILTRGEEAGVRFWDTIKQAESEPEGPSGTWNAFKEIDEERRIDFILVSAEIDRVVAHHTLDPRTDEGRFASDHLPVTATIVP